MYVVLAHIFDAIRIVHGHFEAVRVFVDSKHVDPAVVLLQIVPRYALPLLWKKLQTNRRNSAVWQRRRLDAVVFRVE